MRPRRDRGVRLGSKLTLVHLRNEGGHQLAVANRPRRRAAHRFVGDLLHVRAVKIGPIQDQLDGVHDRLARYRADEREQGLRAETVAVIEDREAHTYSFAASRAASAASFCRAAWPIAAQTTISKIWSWVRPRHRVTNWRITGRSLRSTPW